MQPYGGHESPASKHSAFIVAKYHQLLIVQNAIQMFRRPPKIPEIPRVLCIPPWISFKILGASSWPWHEFEFSRISRIPTDIDQKAGYNF